VDDIEDISLETRDGDQRSSTTGDRLMVALAAVALLGGALIAISRLLPEGDAPMSQASPTLEPSVVQTPRPTPTPGPMESLVLEPGEPEQILDDRQLFAGWIRVLHDTPVYSSAQGAAVVGSLGEGEAAWAGVVGSRDGGKPGWLRVEVPVRGWIPESIAGEPLVRYYTPSGLADEQYIETASAGADGRFVLTGVGVTAGTYGSFLFVSADGHRWTRIQDERWRDSYSIQVAFGPSGWLLLTSVTSPTTYSPEQWVWQSADALEWRPLGRMTGQTEFGSMRIAGSDLGYVLYQPYDGHQRTVWFSADGELWSARPLPGEATNFDTISATSIGYYTFLADGTATSVSAYSADGWTWIAVDNPHAMARMRGVAAVGASLVTVGVEGEEISGWYGTVSDSGVTWESDSRAEEVFDGAFVSGPVVGDGPLAVTFGVDVATGDPLAFLNDGFRWERRVTPQGMRQPVFQAASHGERTVAIDVEATLTGWRPVVWGTADHAAWNEAVPQLVEPVVITEADCAQLERSLLALMTESSYVSAACFGNEPITVTGYAVPCEDCGQALDSVEPKWLTNPPELSKLHLSPIANNDGWGWLDAVLAPGTPRQDGVVGELVTVIGHFNDPAARRCRAISSGSMAGWYPYQPDLERECSARFVVTEVRQVRAR
jgi:hypothetical protein